MKRKYLLIIGLLLLTACGKKDDITEDIIPEEELVDESFGGFGEDDYQIDENEELYEDSVDNLASQDNGNTAPQVSSSSSIKSLTGNNDTSDTNNTNDIVVGNIADIIEDTNEYIATIERFNFAGANGCSMQDICPSYVMSAEIECTNPDWRISYDTENDICKRMEIHDSNGVTLSAINLELLDRDMYYPPEVTDVVNYPNNVSMPGGEHQYFDYVGEKQLLRQMNCSFWKIADIKYSDNVFVLCLTVTDQLADWLPEGVSIQDAMMPEDIVQYLNIPSESVKLYTNKSMEKEIMFTNIY